MARQTKGRLFKSGKKNVFHLQYYVNGKQFVVTLKDEKGEPITREDKARIAADKVLHPVKAANKAEQLRQILDAVETAEKKAERLVMEQDERRQEEVNREKDQRASIAKGWTLFMECPKRPASCKRYTMDTMPPHCTMKNYAAYYRKFSAWMKKHYSDTVLLSQITGKEASAFMESVQTKGASGTFNKYLQFFNCFFDVLTSSGKLNSPNPFRDVERMENRYNSKRPLTMEQIKALLDTAAGDMRLLIALGYFTGLRFGDCCTLQWREVDLLRGVIERIPRKTEHTVKDMAQAVVKVGIPPYLQRLLSDAAPKERTGYVLPDFAAEYLNGKEYRTTRRLLDHFQANGIQTVKEGTGTPEVKDENGKVIRKAVRAVVEIGFHSLRYSYISHNAEAGTPAAIIQRNAGHANPAMTEHYTRISDKAAVKYAAALQLPEESTAGDVIETNAEPLSKEADREALKHIIDTLPIDKIHKIQALLNSL